MIHPRTRNRPALGILSAMAIALVMAALPVFALSNNTANGSANGIVNLAETVAELFDTRGADDGPPTGWSMFRLPGRQAPTRYSVVWEDGRTALEAVAADTASLLVWNREFDPRKLNILQWEWKVEGALPEHPEQNSGFSAEGIPEVLPIETLEEPDYPARVMVLFPFEPEKESLWARMKFKAARVLYGFYPPGKTMNYVWASRRPSGMWITSRSTDRIRIHNIRSGNTDAGQWVRERRDILQDYQEAFGGEIPSRARLAVMVDTDQTHSRTRSLFDSFILSAGSLQSSPAD